MSTSETTAPVGTDPSQPASPSTAIAGNSRDSGTHFLLALVYVSLFGILEVSGWFVLLHHEDFSTLFLGINGVGAAYGIFLLGLSIIAFLKGAVVFHIEQQYLHDVRREKQKTAAAAATTGTE